ncbi:MAG: VCBS repeat-containing protein, partial [Chromatiales bacterium]
IEDFDGDGDQDAAMIAMWADWSFDEPETFVYLENQGGFEFSPASMPIEHFGIWVSIDVADINADEKPDIVLGLGNWPTLVPADWTTRKIMAGRNGEAPTITFLINNY